jgi:alpha-D-xyloside xylohydrolase
MSEYFNRESTTAQQGFHALASVKPKQPIPAGMQFYTTNGLLDIYYFRPGVIRFHFQVDETVDYGLLIGEPQEVSCDIQSLENRVILTAGRIDCNITLSPFSFQIMKDGCVLIESIDDCSMEGPTRFYAFAANEEAVWQVSMALKSSEPVYGLGEKFGRLNHRGELITNWNFDALGINAERSYKNNPFAWSPRGWGVFIHTPGRVKHAVGYSPWSHRSYVLQVEDTNLDFFLFTQPTPAEIIDEYTNLTGKSPALPEWSYGIWLARAFYTTADDLLNAVKGMRDRHIPLDVIVLDGRAWHKPNTRFDFSWDPDRYPDPAGFIQQLRDLNVRLCLWEYPYISIRNPLFAELANRGFLLKTTQGSPYIHTWLPEPISCMLPQLSPSGIIDLTNPEAYEWYRDQHKPLFEIGVAVMKTDFGESIPEHVRAYNGDSGKRLHNVYALLYNRCVYEATQRYGNGEALVWGRAGWTGSQRFPMGWGGDPQSDWEGLAASIRGALSWGMSGVPFYAHDIGGWYGTLKDPELFVRWTQAGVLSSHTRFHGIGPREPWIFGTEIEKIIKKWVDFRYRLIPYLRLCEQEASQTGLPVMRAMPLAFPDDKAAWAFEEQYMLGPSVLVAPIIQPGGSVEVYLPNGNWYDLNTGEALTGGKVILYEGVPLDKCPIFGREGGWMNLGPIVQHTGQLEDENREQEVWVFGKPDPSIGLQSDNIRIENKGDMRKLIMPGSIQMTQFGKK